jgi:hypothetical protein
MGSGGGLTLATVQVTADPAVMTERDDRQRFRVLPEPVLPEDTVETVDVRAQPPLSDEHEDRARMLREAGGGI